MKINVDAALPKKYKESGSDSDCEGWRSHFLGCLGSSPGRPLGGVAEALACREGLVLTVDLGFQTMRVATDCANAARSIQVAGFGSYGPIILEIKRKNGKRR
jgi:hypothetical protein